MLFMKTATRFPIPAQGSALGHGTLLKQPCKGCLIERSIGNPFGVVCYYLSLTQGVALGWIRQSFQDCYYDQRF
jgi:hypothetical protein